MSQAKDDGRKLWVQRDIVRHRNNQVETNNGQRASWVEAKEIRGFLRMYTQAGGDYACSARDLQTSAISAGVERAGSKPGNTPEYSLTAERSR